MTNPIKFAVNGHLESTTCRPDTTVLEWLRGEALLRGSKEGCAEGDCGACSVLLKRQGDKNYVPANSCILLMGQLDGANLVTVEGLAAMGSDGHVVQQRMAENGSSQCGYCTPGIVASLAGLLERNAKPAEHEIHDALAGNLCRCTGYRPIVEAARSTANQIREQLPTAMCDSSSSKVGDSQCTLHSPASLGELLQIWHDYPEAVLLAGGTDLALDVAHARARWPRIISTRQVKQLREVQLTSSQLVIGGAATWDEVLPHLQQYWPSFATLVRRFGSTQIRSMGTVAGNLGTGSPIGDGAPALLALGAHLSLASLDSERLVPMDDFFLGYRRLDLKENEIIKSISIPLPSSTHRFRVYKVSKRYDQDISTVCGAFNLAIENDQVTNARIAFGGMAATPLRCRDAELALTGSSLSSEAVVAAKKAVSETLKPMDDMRGTAAYRSLVAANLIDRLAIDLSGETVEVMAL